MVNIGLMHNAAVCQPEINAISEIYYRFTLYKKILPTRSYEDECATYLPVNPKDNPEHFSI